MSKRLSTTVLLAALVLWPAPAAGQEAEPVTHPRGTGPGQPARLNDPGDRQIPVPLSRLQGDILVDGVIDEAAWSALDPLPLVMQMPSAGGPPSERTNIRVGYDDEYLYVAGELYIPPEEIRAISFKRDLFEATTDYLGIILDTFNDNETAVAFWTTPTGIRLDYTIYNDGQSRIPGVPAVDASWNTFWDVGTRVTEEGWFAEMRIPFSSLRFQDQDGQVTMGLTALRFISGRYEMDTYPEIPPRWGFWSFAKPSQAQRVTLQGVESRNPVYVAPYVLAGVEQDFRLNSAGTAYRRHDGSTREMGVDVKYGLTSDLTLDLTYNTDFAQVEADDQQINLTRFSLFFPEKRQFFLERSSVFDFNLGERDRLFYSRRIGLHDGSVVPIHGGARLVGRVGGWDVGLLDMQTARMAELGGEFGLPSENLGVVRLRRQVLNPYSYAGGIATSRVDADGSYNFTYGLDGVFRLFGDDYLSLAVAQSLENEGGEASPLLESARIHTQWERRRSVGLGYDFTLARSGRAFEPGLGFQLRQDYTRLGSRFSYGWAPGEGSPLARHQLGMGGDVFLRNGDGAVESAAFGPVWTGSPKAGGSFSAALLLSHENLRAPFRLSDSAQVAPGSYTFTEMEGRYETPSGRSVRVAASANAGTFYDGRIFGGSLRPTWIASRYLELSGFYQLSRVTFPRRDQELNVQVGRLRTQVTLNTRLSGVAFLQYNSAADAVIANLRLRYNPREGNDLYLVYNEGLNTDRYGLSPVLPLTSGRTLLLKYTHTLPF